MTNQYKDTVLLLVNTGTPASSEAVDVRQYLCEFLSDRRVVDLPRISWLPILHGIILRRRPKRSAARYQELEALSHPSFMDISLKQAELLKQELRTRGWDWSVLSAMRYGNTRKLRDIVRELLAQKVRRVIVLPLFAQYASVTTGSVFDEITRELQGSKYLPSLQFIPHFYEQRAYIQALAQSVRQNFTPSPAFQKDRLLIVSYHSTLVSDIRQGDPYQSQLNRTTECLAQELGLQLGSMEELDRRELDICLSYQSIFDKREWLLPLTTQVIDRAVAAGYSSISVVAPIFVTDCLETLWDIEIDLKRYVNKLDPQLEFNYIPALNTAPDFIAALADLIQDEVRP